MEPDYLLAQAKQKVTQLQRDYQQMRQEELHLQQEINKLNDERQEFITKARKGRIPHEQFTSQMSALYEKERGVQRRLVTMERAKEDFIKLDLEEQVKKYVLELQSEMTELIHANPQILEERHQISILKKRIVDTVLEEARIDANREIHVRFRTKFLDGRRLHRNAKRQRSHVLH